MVDIFVSYEHSNNQFALQLVDDLTRLGYKVWIDRNRLDGGDEWERKIEEALNECRVFMVVVSPESNESTWVRRETIRSEQLKKPRIPILLAGELPLRLLELQYIDFREVYEGAFADLLKALEEFINPQERNKNEAHRLLGKGVLAFINNDFSEANKSIGQVLTIQPEIARNPEAFWKLLRVDYPTTGGKTFSVEDITFLEKDEIVGVYKNGTTLYKWSVEIANEQILDEIDHVEYKLHPTFKQPLRILRHRGSNFRLIGRGWGGFELDIEVHFKNGQTIPTKYQISLGHVSDEGLQYLRQVAENNLRIDNLYFGGCSITDAGLANLRGLSKLQHLDLQRTSISDAGLEHLQDLVNLQRLVLSRTNIDGSGLQHLQSFTKLINLDLSGTRITDDMLALLQNFPNLSDLNLRETQITVAGLDHLQNLPQLSRLFLQSSGIGEDQQQTAAAKLPNCQIFF